MLQALAKNPADRPQTCGELRDALERSLVDVTSSHTVRAAEPPEVMTERDGNEMRLIAGGPFPLGYNGLGDIFVFVFFGLVAVCTTFYVQTGGLTPDVATLAMFSRSITMFRACRNALLLNGLVSLLRNSASIPRPPAAHWW